MPNGVTRHRCFWDEEEGQDLIEYALMAGFVAVAAGAILTPVAPTLGVLFSRVHSLLVKYGGQ